MTGFKRILLLSFIFLFAFTGCAKTAESTAAESAAGTDAADTGIPIKTVKTDSWEMDYFSFGKGAKTLVIIPGLGVQSVMGSADMIAVSYYSMTEDYTIYVFDRRKEIPEDYSIRDMARDTAEAVKAVGLEHVDVFGASQGGMIAIEFTAQYPELVDKLVIGSTSAKIDATQFAVIDEWIDLARKGDVEALYMSFGKAIYPEGTFEMSKNALIEASKTVTREELDRFIILAESMRGLDITADLDKISCPVLLTGASDDGVLGSAATDVIAEHLKDVPGFELKMYEGFGHAAYDSAPDYRSVMLEFLLK